VRQARTLCCRLPREDGEQRKLQAPTEDKEQAPVKTQSQAQTQEKERAEMKEERRPRQEGPSDGQSKQR
jgi:hypothetical protein